MKTKLLIYDDYCDDMYAINNNENHETCHLDFNFQLDYASHDSYFVEFAPTIPNEKNFAYVESSKISMLVAHEKNALCGPSRPPPSRPVHSTPGPAPGRPGYVICELMEATQELAITNPA